MGGKRKRVRRRVESRGAPRDGRAPKPGMSSVLLHLAQPLLDDMPKPPPRDDLEQVLSLAGVAWNLSREAPPDAWREAFRDSLEDRDSPLRADPVFEETILFLAARACELYPDLDATVAAVQIAPDATGRMAIQTASLRHS